MHGISLYRFQKNRISKTCEIAALADVHTAAEPFPISSNAHDC
jgi:hypothetical protein